MDSADALLGGLASGDKAPLDATQPAPAMKRDQDSTDDFEHLDRDGKREMTESPQHQQATATRSFLDMERELLADAPRAPSADQLADKFTDSESDADTAGESPLHRPASGQRAAHTPEPPLDPTPVLAPAPAPAPAPQLAPSPAPAPLDKPLPEEPKPAVVPEPKPEPPKPELPKPEPPKPEPVKREPSPPPKASAPEPARPTAHVIEAEVIFCQMGLVESLIYWRSAAHSGAALGAGLALLVALACCSVVSVAAYASLLALSAAVAFRIYKNVLQAVQKTNDGHPFKWLLEKDVSVSAERAQSLAAAATAHLNAALAELRRLFLVEDLVDSLKFGVLLWCLTYVGACFNGITLIILGWIALFTLPKAYEMNKAQVDANLELARAKINEISSKVRAAVPLGRKSESEKDK
ncbi:reticulon isoform X2 [Anticarsia gemmatalis]|uniref:reticulon isoform X2 n=1 Tax=Anticarsia gemmatalis TaxID=129554 RepID=UPI003F7587EF